jgi:hypothetical protein
LILAQDHHKGLVYQDYLEGLVSVIVYQVIW